MTSHSLFTRLHLRQPGRPDGMRFLHRFSDSLLHTVLMVGLALLVGLVLYEALTFSYEYWRLDTVFVHGQAKPLK